MSFLSILLVASTFYFAHARPDAQSWPEVSVDVQANVGGVEQEPPVPPEEYSAPPEEYSVPPEEHSVPVTDPKDYQHKFFDFMKDVEKAVDQYMTPLMSKLDVKKQDELKSMSMDGFASYMNYLILMNFVNKNDKGDDQVHGDPLTRNEMIIQFESDYPLDPNIPYMAATYGKDEEYGD